MKSKGDIVFRRKSSVILNLILTDLLYMLAAKNSLLFRLAKVIKFHKGEVKIHSHYRVRDLENN
jgi:hypothetical protein